MGIWISETRRTLGWRAFGPEGLEGGGQGI